MESALFTADKGGRLDLCRPFFLPQSLCEEKVLLPGAGEMYGASELAVRFYFCWSAGAVLNALWLWKGNLAYWSEHSCSEARLIAEKSFSQRFVHRTIGWAEKRGMAICDEISIDFVAHYIIRQIFGETVEGSNGHKRA